MSLRSLSDSDILSRIQNLVRQEREITLLVLAHLNEIERRRLHLKLGYPSLFEYCTSMLGYSASAAGRRIQTARCIARFPGVYELLQKNEANVSTIAQVSRALTDANHAELLSRIRGKSQREVEAILAEYQSCPVPRDRVRTVVVRVPAFAVTTHSSDPYEKSDYSRYGSEDASPIATDQPSITAQTPATTAKHVEKRVLLQFSVRPEFMTKLGRIRSLAGQRLPANASLEQVFELMMDSMIERDDPAKRIERRKQRKERKSHGARPADAGSKQPPRHIPAPVRDQVFQRDGGRCTFMGSGGHRCGATISLQIDHVTPVALGGRSEPDNLRLLCAHHNRLESERLLGPAAGFRRAHT